MARNCLKMSGVQNWERIMKAGIENHHVIYTDKCVRIIVDFFAETLQRPRKAKNDALQSLKENNYKPCFMLI